MKFLWITDPWETLDHAKDTSLRLIQESIALGHENHWVDVKTLRRDSDRTLCSAWRVKDAGVGRRAGDFLFGPAREIEPSRFDKVLYRTDPPVDLAYLHPLQILALGLGRAELINPAEALFIGNEKLQGSLIPGLTPPTLAASQWDVLKAFGKKQGRVVLKPLHEAQSKGVELLDFRTPRGTREAHDHLARVSAEFSAPVLLQRYLEGIADGEQRLWFLDGELIACVRKNPRKGQFRIDMDRGGFLSPTRLTAKETKAAAQVGKLLRAHRIRLAAVDLIESKVTDFNFTSPGLLTPMEDIIGKNLARAVIKRLVQRWP